MYQQQLRFWYKNKQLLCLQDKFLQDLAAEVREWQLEGEEVLIMADMNEDVLVDNTRQFCQDTNLVEAIEQLHGPSAVPAHQCRSKAINGIFISSAIQAEIQGGFLLFGMVTISNHRIVWLDIPAHLFEMAQLQNIRQPVGRCLKCQDP